MLVEFQKAYNGGTVWIESEYVEAVYRSSGAGHVTQVVAQHITIDVDGEPAAIAARVNVFNEHTEVTETDTVTQGAYDTNVREQRVFHPGDVLRAMHRAPRLLWEERYEAPGDYRLTTVRFHENLYETMVTGEGTYDGLTWTSRDARDAWNLFEAITEKLRRQGDPRDIPGWTPQ